MDEEVEDLIGDVRYTDSQKSVTTSAVYSMDFTDSSPERHNSSGKETYVLDREDSDDSESTFRLHRGESRTNLNDAMCHKPDMQQLLYHEINKSLRANFRTNAFNHEFTQTSKTIIELAQNEIFIVHKPIRSKSLETQTSYVSVEHKTVDCNVRLIQEDCVCKQKGGINLCNIDRMLLPSNRSQLIGNQDQMITEKLIPQNNSNEIDINVEKSLSTYDEPELESKHENDSDHSSEDQIIHFIDDEPKENEDYKETASDFTSSKYDSEIEEDSLMMETEYRRSKRSKGDNASDMSETQKSIENDVEELYNKLSESPLLLSSEIPMEPCARQFGTLTPLSEETSQKKSFIDVTSSSQTLMEPTKDTDNETLFSNNAVKVKMFTNSEVIGDTNKFQLPPIRNISYPNSPHLNFLFSVNTMRSTGKAGTLPSLYESHNGEMIDSWEFTSRELASGESPLISGRSDPVKTPRESVHLPPIHGEGSIYHKNKNKAANLVSPHLSKRASSSETTQDAISIKGRIRELKTMTNNKAWSKLETRCGSPTSNSSPDGSRLCDIAERGCDNLCLELLRRLRSPSWMETVEALEDIPMSLEKYWSVISVNRTAELLRQVVVHIDSARTQVARTACNILAEILKNTNYTRKPDFHESISMLLTKTGSFSRPVRRAANVALDDIVCGVDVTQAITAICIYGVGHKSALVRCASARLLVVCCALAEGGRQILRARPPSAATARRQVLRALAELLQDKNIDTRKYAERLYAILRPLPSFEAYFLTDVDLELAARHMKKYDAMLLPNKQDRDTSPSIFG